MRLLILGGSGFLSGTLAREAQAQGDDVSILTRGIKPTPNGVRQIQADRKDHLGTARALAKLGPWDLVVDCIGYEAEDARQDLELFTAHCRHLVFISTDFVYHPRHRSIPQPEAGAIYYSEGYGGQKRAAEEVFLTAGTQNLKWTIFRPGHIYGPGSQLGCLPRHGRDPHLIAHLKKGTALRLVGGGRFLQHPVYAPDLAKTILDIPERDNCAGQIFNIANPDVISSRRYYELIAEILGVEVTIEEVETETYLVEEPSQAPFCCDRVSDLTLLKRSGLILPKTNLKDGLTRQIEWLQQTGGVIAH